jgi:hypothetical protein
MITSLRQVLTKLTLKVLFLLDSNYQRPTQILTTPSGALEQMMEIVDKYNKDLINKPTVPTDTIEVINYRAGAKMYREQLLKAIDDNSKAHITAGLKRRA